MTKSFEAKVTKERTVCTRKYCYTIKERYDADEQWMEIRRLPICQLDTTAAIDGWEIVKVIK